jgi:hypothetical protein
MGGVLQSMIAGRKREAIARSMECRKESEGNSEVNDCRKEAGGSGEIVDCRKEAGRVSRSARNADEAEGYRAALQTVLGEGDS